MRDCDLSSEECSILIHKLEQHGWYKPTTEEKTAFVNFVNFDHDVEVLDDNFSTFKCQRIGKDCPTLFTLLLARLNLCSKTRERYKYYFLYLANIQNRGEETPDQLVVVSYSTGASYTVMPPFHSTKSGLAMDYLPIILRVTSEADDLIQLLKHDIAVEDVDIITMI